MRVPVTTLHWQTSYRLIPTRYPEVNLFERVSEPEEEEALQRIEEMTSDRARQADGIINRLQSGDHFSASKSSYNVEASFAYSTEPSRFNSGAYGVYYTAHDLQTAVAETVYHTTLFMAATNEPPMLLQQRVIVSEIKGAFHDIRGLQAKLPEIYSSSSYAASQAFALSLWKEGAGGIVYDSVRRPEGECAVVFRPQVIHHPRQDRCMAYEWDGKKISRVFQLQEFPT